MESGLRSSRYVENICICTNMFSNNVVALISPNRKVLRELAKSINKGDLEISEICEDEVINDIVLDAIRQSGVRAELKSKEIPVRIKLTSYEWTPDNNLLTAAFKLKRKKVYEYYKEEIDSMFNSIKPQWSHTEWKSFFWLHFDLWLEKSPYHTRIFFLGAI